MLDHPFLGDPSDHYPSPEGSQTGDGMCPAIPQPLLSLPGWWFQPTPLKNHGVRQLGYVGMMTFPMSGKSFKIPWFQSPPTVDRSSNRSASGTSGAHIGDQGKSRIFVVPPGINHQDELFLQIHNSIDWCIVVVYVFKYYHQVI